MDVDVSVISTSLPYPHTHTSSEKGRAIKHVQLKSDVSSLVRMNRSLIESLFVPAANLFSSYSTLGFDRESLSPRLSFICHLSRVSGTSKIRHLKHTYHSRLDICDQEDTSLRACMTKR